MKPLRHLLARQVLGLQAPLVCLLVGLVWWGSRALMLERAEQEGVIHLRLAVRELENRLATLEQAGQTLALYHAQQRLPFRDPAAGVSVLMPWLSTQRVVPLVNLVDESGQSLMLIRNAEGWRAREIRERPGGGLELRWRRVGPDGSGEDDHPFAPALTYRPTARGWYREARSLVTPRWSTPYHLDPPESRLVVTWLMPLRDASGAVEGAIGVDLLADEFQALLDLLRPTPRSRIWVTNRHGIPLASAHGTEAPVKPPTAEGTVQLGGTAHRVLALDLPGHPGAEWCMVLAIPESDLLRAVLPRLVWLTAAASLLLLAPLLGSFLLGRRLAGEVATLAESARGLGTGHPPPSGAHRIEEFALLGATLGRAHQDTEARLILERKLQQQQRWEMLGTLAGGVAHHVNNYLCGILGRVGLARELVPEPHPAAVQLVAAEEAGVACSRLVAALMAFSRPGEPDLQAVDANDLLIQMAGLLRPLLGDGIHLDLDLDPEAPRICADRVQLEQVLVNLALNARDAMPAGGRLVLETRRSDAGDLRISVRDTGTGIPPEAASRIFEPFFTTKPVGQGAGLGLSQSFGILQAHHGRLELAETSEAGSTLVITLPPCPP